MRTATWLLVGLVALGSSWTAEAVAQGPTKNGTRVAFERACEWRVANPIVSPDGARVFMCNGVFGADRGQYLGPGPGHMAMATLQDGRVLVADWTNGGLFVRSTTGGTSKHHPGGVVEGIRVSPDGARVAILEKVPSPPSKKKESPRDDRLLVVRDATTFAKISETLLAQPPGRSFPIDMGFTRDGRALVTVPPSEAACAKDRQCHLASVSVVTKDGALQPLRDVGKNARAVAFARDGSVLAEVGAGVVRVVDLASEVPKTLAERRLPEDGYVGAMAVAPGGSRVAVQFTEELLIFAREGATLDETFKADDRTVYAHHLAFADDGRLFTGGSRMLGIFPSAAKPEASRSPTFAYAAAAPKGFERAVHGKEGLTFRSKNTLASRLGEVAAYRHPKEHATVRVSVTAKDEFSASATLDAWKKNVLARFADGLGARGSHAVAWQNERGERTVDFFVLGADGCDPMDTFTRVTERPGGALVRVELETLPFGNTSPKKLDGWFRVFVEEPLGVGPVRILTKVPKRRPTGDGCGG